MSFQHPFRGGSDHHRPLLRPSLMESPGGGHHDHALDHARYYSGERRNWDQAHCVVNGLEHLHRPQSHLHQSASWYGFAAPEYSSQQWRSWESMYVRTSYPSVYSHRQGIVYRPHFNFVANHQAPVTRDSHQHVGRSLHWRSSPPPRPMIVLSDPATDSNGRAFPKLSVMTYNVLAQDLIEKNPSLYTHAQPEHLEWAYRRVRIMQELLESRADVICLQEVEEEQYHSFFVPQLQSQGYEHLYQKRTGSHVDGCAVFYQTKRLHLVASARVNYQRHDGALNRDNVGLIVRLRFLEGRDRKMEFCIATTHLLFNPKAGEVKLAQLSMLLAELHKLASDGETLLPCILSGDFNCVPKASLVDFILNGRLDYSNLSAHTIAGYFKHSESRQRTIPFPLLPDNLHIGQDCVYHHPDTLSDTTMSEAQPIPEVVMEDVTDPSVATDHSVATSPVEIIDLTLTDDEHGEQVVLEPMEKNPEESVDRLQESVKPPTCSANASLPLKTEPLQRHSSPNTASSTSASHAAADTERDCSSSPSPSYRKRPNPDSRSQADRPSSRLEGTAMLTHPFSFKSAYPLPPDRHSYHSITTYHCHACEMVDYVFYTPAQGQGWSHGSGFHLTSRKALPSTHTLFKLGPQPNKLLSSDHLYLLAEFQLMGDQK